ncbi:chemotaxis protein CheD [Caulobacter sp. S45]|uniref:chemotaxis protein CheD n=1 Tax=Caulobacter sp. S45 TaxID=1641861 RepID=UPI00131C9DAA|nr:chemotaxis protein CheD [Caulobacter sp. S45]
MIGASSLRETPDHDGPERRINVVQGEYQVTTDPGVVLTTLLGSCVAACMRDPVAGVGGMNHFLLPGDDREGDTESLRYGVHSMELLVNGLLRAGARRDRLEGKLFGGARLLRGLTDIGELNSTFAEGFFQREGIRLVGGSLRGEHGRRVQYWHATGRARQMALGNDAAAVFDAERRRSKPTPAPASDGALELF